VIWLTAAASAEECAARAAAFLVRDYFPTLLSAAAST